MVSLTTAQLEAAALTVPCPEHRVSEGAPCPVRPGAAFGAACMTRRQLADGRRRLADMPGEQELGRLGHGDMLLFVLWLRDAAQGLSDCVDAALGVPLDDRAGSAPGCLRVPGQPGC
jgi:hypothetical protein